MKPTQQSSALQPAAAAATKNTRGKRVKSGAGTIGELFRALNASGRWWMMPMVATLLVCSVLLVVIAAVQYVAPFVYTIF